MAAQSRRTDPSVEDNLFEAGYGFDFFQAVRVLERLYPERRPVGQAASPADEVVRFHSHLSLSFPPSAIHHIERAASEMEPAQMTVTFMGLTGPLGVLPRHYTEMLLQRVRQRDYTLRDFFDLFNHRLISLLYRAWEKYRVPVAYERAALQRREYDRFSLLLFDLMGMGTDGLRGRQQVEDKALLFYTGLLAQQPHSASALAGILQDYFRVPVAVEQCLGQWLPLTESNRSRLGGGEGTNCLGVNAVAGPYVWDQQAKFRVRPGPLTLRQFETLLPSGNAFQTLVHLSRFFAGQEYDFEVQLILKAAEVPRSRLGAGGVGFTRLGWSAWLKNREFVDDADDAVFVGTSASLGT
ncbi:MAG: type VI secretion system baseplate subunit TssG [Candidatus Tectomicrobia bacterium]|nr:type VI secretion system baseplate subunit TssG [Candidatus Tectomicrobia bacterium]